jgi:hypothetical protein
VLAEAIFFLMSTSKLGHEKAWCSFIARCAATSKTVLLVLVIWRVDWLTSFWFHVRIPVERPGFLYNKVFLRALRGCHHSFSLPTPYRPFAAFLTLSFLAQF